MGAKTKAKVKEIITTGSYRRNEYMANSERQSALKLVRSCVTGRLHIAEAGTVSECSPCDCGNGAWVHRLSALHGQQRVPEHTQVGQDCGRSCVTGSTRSRRGAATGDCSMLQLAQPLMSCWVVARALLTTSIASSRPQSVLKLGSHTMGTVLTMHPAWSYDGPESISLPACSSSASLGQVRPSARSGTMTAAAHYQTCGAAAISPSNRWVPVLLWKLDWGASKEHGCQSAFYVCPRCQQKDCLSDLDEHSRWGASAACAVG